MGDKPRSESVAADSGRLLSGRSQVRILPRGLPSSPAPAARTRSGPLNGSWFVLTRMTAVRAGVTDLRASAPAESFSLPDVAERLELATDLRGDRRGCLVRPVGLTTPRQVGGDLAWRPRAFGIVRWQVTRMARAGQTIVGAGGANDGGRGRDDRWWARAPGLCQTPLLPQILPRRCRERGPGWPKPAASAIKGRTRPESVATQDLTPIKIILNRVRSCIATFDCAGIGLAPGRRLGYQGRRPPAMLSRGGAMQRGRGFMAGRKP